MSIFFLKKIFKYFSFNLVKRISYAQEGEDLFLERIFNSQKNGFYVDIGAHHPIRFSTTLLFYKKGWKGINVEPLPNSKKIFDIFRSRDINLEIGISNSEKKIIYNIFQESALNTFDVDMANKRKKVSKLINKVEIPVYKLKNVLDKNLPKNQKIDFMNIDGQGLEISILDSNDWETYRPKFLLLEYLPLQGKSVEYVLKDPICKYMSEKGYCLYTKTYSTLIFQELL